MQLVLPRLPRSLNTLEYYSSGEVALAASSFAKVGFHPGVGWLETLIEVGRDTLVVGREWRAWLVSSSKETAQACIQAPRPAGPRPGVLCDSNSDVGLVIARGPRSSATFAVSTPTPCRP